MCQLNNIIFFLYAVGLFIHIYCTVVQSHIRLSNEFYEPEMSNSCTRLIHRPKLKYILQWVTPKSAPFFYKGFSEDEVEKKICSFTNCEVTSNRYLLSDVTQFDAILFYPPDVFPVKNEDFPETRSPHQKYVFTSKESSMYYPLCLHSLEGFFNWSWTYKLDSDVSWTYIIIKDVKTGNVIGPKKIMHWLKLDAMDRVSEEFKAQLRSKTKAAAWFVSNCGDRSGRKLFADELQVELAKFNLTLDVYGKCGELKCGKFKSELRCDELIKDHYYFYLAFENSFSEDYVTEKLLRALQFNAIPIVYGFANYTRFMPDGLYLNAKELGPKALAAKMNELINSPEEYSNYFRWKNHYSYHSRYEEGLPEFSDYCNFCAALNDEKKMQTSVIQNFQQWWDNAGQCYK